METFLQQTPEIDGIEHIIDDIDAMLAQDPDLEAARIAFYTKLRKSPEYPGGPEDGMTVACAEPITMPLPELWKTFTREHQLPGFSYEKFVSTHLKLPVFNTASVLAGPGEDIGTFIRDMRPKLLRPKQGTSSACLPMRNEYSAAGGRFDLHSYPHDSYQLIKGYAADGEWGKVEQVVDNMACHIEEYGYPLNGNAWFYKSRTQIPYFSHAVRMLAEHKGEEALIQYLPQMEQEYAYWMAGKDNLGQLPLDDAAHAEGCLVRMPDGSFLNRYWDSGKGPRTESCLEDMLLAEEVIDKEGLRDAPEAVRANRLEKLYADIRAGAASGWDYSSRWFADGQSMLTINTTDILPIDLNSLMAYTEESLALANIAAGNTERADEYWRLLEDRRAAINTYAWDPIDKVYKDVNFVATVEKDGKPVAGKRTDVLSIAAVYPLYVGIADPDRALGVADMAEQDLLAEGGYMVTNRVTKEQWDSNVWMLPSGWVAARGFARMAHEVGIDTEEGERFLEMSLQGRARIMQAVRQIFTLYHIVPEKIDGHNPLELAGGGEYSLVKVLAMTMEGYRALEAWKPSDSGGCLPLGRCAMAHTFAR